jgi:hypothetical protein
MIIRRFILGSFVLLLGAVLLTGQTSASSITEQDLSEATVGDYFVPSPLEPQLSTDGQSMYYAVAPVVYVADPNPAREQIRVPPPLDLAQASESATATFSVSYIPNGGYDLWGQYCYTFPENAKAAFNAAAAVWGNLLKSSVPITIRACWANLGSSSTLGYSGGGTIHRDFTNAPRSHTWYSASLANSLAGYDLDTNNSDMHITYNMNFTWYYGTDGNTPDGQYDLMSVVLHEICHGLNFAGSMQYSDTSGMGSWGKDGYPNIYDTFVKDGSGNLLINTGVYPNPSTALANALRSNNIWFYGSNAMAANGGSLVKMYAPSTWKPGSSYSHLDIDTFGGTVNRLMVYAISSGVSTHDPGPVTKGLLKDLGWGGGTPGAATLISPSGPITTTKPTYTWNVVKDAGFYQLWVNGPSGKVIGGGWYTSAQAHCDTETCWLQPDVALALGSYTWAIQTASSGGLAGAWSTPLYFSLGRTTLYLPSGTISTAQPTYSWSSVEGATHYLLWVNGSSGHVFDTWYDVTDTAKITCASGTCSVTPGKALASDDYTWWILPYGGGYGFLSDPKTFSFGKVTLISPSGPIKNVKPTYTWSSVAGATHYQLYVNGPSGKAAGDWYTASQAHCDTQTCWFQPDVTLAFGNYAWYVQPYSPTGLGAWSSGLGFSLGTVTLTSPSGTIGTGKPTYIWSSVEGASYYQLYVNGPSGKAAGDWYTSTQANCDTQTCSFQPNVVLGYGKYTWYVQPYSPGGLGPWSAGTSFFVNDLTNGVNVGFDTGAEGWVGRTGDWSTTQGYLTAPGVSQKNVTAYFQPAQFSNFYYHAKFYRAGCSYCSNELLVRGNPSTLASTDIWANTYRFNIAVDGYFSVFKYVNGSSTRLCDWTYWPYITGGWNELNVYVQGGNLYFGINGVWLFGVTDNSFSSGYVGLGYYTDTDATGNQMWVDWAQLIPLSSSSLEGDMGMVISPDQLKLNQAAPNGETVGDADRLLAPK